MTHTDDKDIYVALIETKFEFLAILETPSTEQKTF